MEKRSVRTVLVTGCSDGGLGAALALAFHKHRGYRVFATARKVERMTHLRSLGIETLALDVLSEESIAACVEKVSSLTGATLDVLVNNAGAGYNMPIMDASSEQIRNQFDLNVFSVIRVIQSFFPLLRASSSPTKMIVNNTSCAPVLAFPFLGPYTASKAALSTFTETLRLEMQPFDIKVVDLKTGAVKSHFFDNVSSNAAVVVPENSPYAAGKDVVEKFMQKGPPAKLMDADVWAKNVVADLSKRGGKGAPVQVWRGAGATSAWFAATFIPVGWLDGTLRKYSGLDEVERRVREEKEKKSMAQ
jgi:NAD(P)-dependent dehydrogenase (short-subunit alcohol dehydrogenase family)